MKKALIFLVLFTACFSGLYAQKGTIIYLDKENGLNGMSVGADFSTVPKDAITTISEIDSATIYHFSRSHKFILGDEELKIRSFTVIIYHNKILLINVIFSGDGPEMLKKLTSIYGPYTARPYKDSDQYAWRSGKVALTANYTDPKNEYLNFTDMRMLKHYKLHIDSSKAEHVVKLPLNDSVGRKSNYFIAVEEKSYTNTIYKVFITDSLLMCAKVNSYFLYPSVPKSQMHDADAYVNKKMDAKYTDISDVQSFLKADGSNFIIRKKDIENVVNAVIKKSGIGYYSYGGRIYISLYSKRLAIGFLLLGDQDAVEIMNRLRQR